MKRNTRAAFIAQGALIAALYIVLTEISAFFGLSSGAVQLRISEALCALPLWFPSAVPGLFVGCIISNILTGCALWDIIFGSLATLAGAWCASKMQRVKHLAPIPTILANTLVVPPILAFVYQVPETLWYIYITVFLGEFLSAGILGTLLCLLLKKRQGK